MVFYIYDNIGQNILRKIIFPSKSLRENQRHSMLSDCLSENRVVYEIKSENTVEPERPQIMTHALCMLHIQGYTRASTRPCPFTLTQALALTHLPTNTHTHTHRNM